MAILTGVGRRRWRLAKKLRILVELEQPVVSFAALARRHEVSHGLLWNWPRQVRRGELVPEPMPVFTPVQITADPPLARVAELEQDGERLRVQPDRNRVVGCHLRQGGC